MPWQWDGTVVFSLWRSDALWGMVHRRKTYHLPRDEVKTICGITWWSAMPFTEARSEGLQICRNCRAVLLARSRKASSCK